MGIRHGNDEVEGPGNKDTLCGDRKFTMKTVRKNESVCEPEIDGPAAVEELSPAAALKRHNP